MTIPRIEVRDETNADLEAITRVTVEAFRSMEISSHTEHFIVLALRAAQALSVSLVAEVDGTVAGHIAFSPLGMEDGTTDWYGLGPVSVLPELQHMGIGSALIMEGLSRLRGLNARGCCLVGHPGYYRRFGFENATGLGHEGVPQEAFFVLSFDGTMPQGLVRFHEAFMANGPQGEEPTIKCGRHLALHADMAGSRFHDVNLAGADFDDVNLGGARFHNINLSDIQVSAVQIGGATFRHVGPPPDSDGNQARQRPVTFEEVMLCDSIFRNVDMSNVKIIDCDITGMTVDGVPVTDMLLAYRKMKG